MKLEKKKALAARTLGVGKNRIVFNSARLSELKDAITKQDIKDLKTSGVISIKDKRGRRTLEKRKTRRRGGSVRKKVKGTKRNYVVLTRKLRSYLAHLKRQDSISRENYLSLRNEIKASLFRSLSHMKEHIKQMEESA